MDPKKAFGGLVLILALLWLIGRIASTPSRAANTGISGDSSSQTVPHDKWVVREETSPMDSSKIVILTLNAENTISSVTGDRKPSLLIRCKEGKTDTYVSTGVPASVEEDIEGGPSEDHHVRLRFDENPPITDRWVEATNHGGLFATDGISAAKQIAGAHKLAFEFTPFDANPATIQFDLNSLSSHLQMVADACKWSLN
jgi:hypothetical protein